MTNLLTEASALELAEKMLVDNHISEVGNYRYSEETFTSCIVRALLRAQKEGQIAATLDYAEYKTCSKVYRLRELRAELEKL